MTGRVLNVWWDGRIVGLFTQDRHGDIGFAYAGAWFDDEKALPLSASFPKRPERLSRQECRPFFGGLLPEERQRPKIEMVGEDELPLGRDFCAMSIVQPGRHASGD